MVDLPKKKVGVIACSGEELPEGTVTRLAALKVLEALRPTDTVTICLPLFLAGGEGDRAFARFYPTIAVDGCELRCAARATERYSARPTASLVVTELVEQRGMAKPQGRRWLDRAGMEAVDLVAERIVEHVDEALAQNWSRRGSIFIAVDPSLEIHVEVQAPVEAACSCGSGIPVREIIIDGQVVTLIALPLIFEALWQAGKLPSDEMAGELLETAKVYNSIPAGMEAAYRRALLREYAAYCAEKEPAR